MRAEALESAGQTVQAPLNPSSHDPLPPITALLVPTLRHRLPSSTLITELMALTEGQLQASHLFVCR
jgi:hypothetical protein